MIRTIQQFQIRLFLRRKTKVVHPSNGAPLDKTQGIHYPAPLRDNQRQRLLQRSQPFIHPRSAQGPQDGRWRTVQKAA